MICIKLSFAILSIENKKVSPYMESELLLFTISFIINKKLCVIKNIIAKWKSKV